MKPYCSFFVCFCSSFVFRNPVSCMFSSILFIFIIIIIKDYTLIQTYVTCGSAVRETWLLKSSDTNLPCTSFQDDGGVVVQRGLWFRFTCNFCHKNFNHKNNFRKHLRTHTGEKPYMCPQCSYCSARSDLLRAHLHKKHPYVSSSTQVQETLFFKLWGLTCSTNM